MTIAPLAGTPEVLAGIDREVDKIIGSNDGKTLDALEALRQKYLFRFYIGLIVIVTTAILFFMLGTWHARTYGDSKGFSKLLVVGWAIITFICVAPIQFYKTNARQMLMPALVKRFGDLSWSESMRDAVFFDGLRTSSLVGIFDDQNVSDFITGTIKGINVKLAEMTLSLGSGKSRRTIFKGAGILIQLQKPAPTRLIIKPRQLALNFMPKDMPPEIGIPYAGFNKLFHAYSDDQVLGRTLLTPDVVEQLIKLAMLFDNHHLGASLRDDRLFLIAPGAGELDPESLFTSAYKLDRVHKVGRQLYLLSTLIETIMQDWKLDTATPYQVALNSP